MNLFQFYETLILRDIMFYFLPGGTSLFGLILIFWAQAQDGSRKAISPYIPAETLTRMVIFLTASYICGHILYMIHNRTVGKIKSLRRHEMLGRFLAIDKSNEDLPKCIQELKEGMVKALFDQPENKKGFITHENLRQLYFIGDKYILLKKPEFYTTYISRLTATSRFYGVMSVGWAVIAFACSSFFFTQAIPFSLNIVIILALFIFSFWFIRSSINDQEELVWNLVQATYLLYLEDQRSLRQSTQGNTDQKQAKQLTV